MEFDGHRLSSLIGMQKEIDDMFLKMLDPISKFKVDFIPKIVWITIITFSTIVTFYHGYYNLFLLIHFVKFQENYRAECRKARSLYEILSRDEGRNFAQLTELETLNTSGNMDKSLNPLIVKVIRNAFQIKLFHQHQNTIILDFFSGSNF